MNTFQHHNPQLQQPMQASYGEPPEFGFADGGEPEINVMEYVKLVWARKWIVVAIVVLTTSVAAVRAFTQPKMYKSSTMVALDAAPQLSNNQFDSYMNFWQMDRYIRDQMSVLSTYQLAQRVVNRLGIDGEGDPALGLLGRLDSEQLEETDVIVLSMVGEDPEQTAEWLNIYVEEYIASNIEDSLHRTRQIYKVIQSRLDPLRLSVSASESALMEFSERKDALLFAEQDKNVITEQVNTLTSAYAQAKADRIRIETKLGALRNLSASNLVDKGFPEVVQDTTIQGLREQKNAAEIELADKLRNLKEGHPQIKELRSRITNLDKRTEEHIRTIRNAMETDFDIVSRREKSLYNNIQQLKDQSIQLSKQTLEFDGLKREYEQNKRFFEDMLARSKEADLSTTASVNNIRIIEPARPATVPYSPNIKRTIMVGIALGLFLGVGLILGLDFLDHTIRTPDHVGRYTGLETVCTLPIMTADNLRIAKENFQSLRTAMMLAARGDDCHILMVTSAVPSEGKTTVSFNLAKVFAEGGAKVLLIDADLRKPRLHREVGVKNVVGLTSVVLGENDLASVVHQLDDVPNLDIMTSGPLPPNPPELFGKLTYKRLLENASEIYDWILIDTPPVASVTDPVICSSLAHMAIIVVQYGHAKRQLVTEAVRSLSRTGVRLVGIVLNKVDVERDHYYYSYYYSYYRYGHYGDNDDASA